MSVSNVLRELDYPMCPGNGTSQCALEKRIANSPGNGTIQCALGLGLTNVPWEWD